MSPLSVWERGVQSHIHHGHWAVSVHVPLKGLDPEWIYPQGEPCHACLLNSLDSLSYAKSADPLHTGMGKTRREQREMLRADTAGQWLPSPYLFLVALARKDLREITVDTRS